MSTQTRQPSGIPVGGQFATTHRAEVGTELDAAHAVGAVDLDAWAPGEDVDDDSLVAEELRTLRARVAEYEKAQQPPGPVYAHIQAIAGPAGFHPTRGVMPAMLACIADRGEDDMDPYLLALCSDDLGDLYDSNIGPAVDRLEAAIRETVDERERANALHHALTR